MSRIKQFLALMGAVGLMAAAPVTPAHAADGKTNGGAPAVRTPIGSPSRAAASYTPDYFPIRNCDQYGNRNSGPLEWFHVDDDGYVWHQRENASGPMEYLRGKVLFNGVAGFQNGDCRIEIFGVGTDGKMYTTWQYQPAGTSWPTNWASLDGGFTGAPATYVWGGGLNGVCAPGLDNATWCRHHTQPYGSPWTPWESLG